MMKLNLKSLGLSKKYAVIILIVLLTLLIFIGPTCVSFSEKVLPYNSVKEGMNHSNGQNYELIDIANIKVSNDKYDWSNDRLRKENGNVVGRPDIEFKLYGENDIIKLNGESTGKALLNVPGSEDGSQGFLGYNFYEKTSSGWSEIDGGGLTTGSDYRGKLQPEWHYWLTQWRDINAPLKYTVTYKSTAEGSPKTLTSTVYYSGGFDIGSDGNVIQKGQWSYTDPTATQTTATVAAQPVPQGPDMSQQQSGPPPSSTMQQSGPPPGDMQQSGPPPGDMQQSGPPADEMQQSGPAPAGDMQQIEPPPDSGMYHSGMYQEQPHDGDMQQIGPPPDSGMYHSGMYQEQPHEYDWVEAEEYHHDFPDYHDENTQHGTTLASQSGSLIHADNSNTMNEEAYHREIERAHHRPEHSMPSHGLHDNIPSGHHPAEHTAMESSARYASLKEMSDHVKDYHHNQSAQPVNLIYLQRYTKPDPQAVRPLTPLLPSNLGVNVNMTHNLNQRASQQLNRGITVMHHVMTNANR
jgi:hypothetical protein